jgi:hypothetical protein
VPDGLDWMDMTSSGGPVGLSNSTLDLHSPSPRVSARFAPGYELPDYLRRWGHRIHQVTANRGRRAPGFCSQQRHGLYSDSDFFFQHQMKCTSVGMVRGMRPLVLRKDGDNGRNQTLLLQHLAGQTGPNPGNTIEVFVPANQRRRDQLFLSARKRGRLHQWSLSLGFIANSLLLFADEFRHFTITFA